MDEFGGTPRDRAWAAVIFARDRDDAIKSTDIMNQASVSRDTARGVLHAAEDIGLFERKTPRSHIYEPTSGHLELPSAQDDWRVEPDATPKFGFEESSISKSEAEEMLNVTDRDSALDVLRRYHERAPNWPNQRAAHDYTSWRMHLPPFEMSDRVGDFERGLRPSNRPFYYSADGETVHIEFSTAGPRADLGAYTVWWMHRDGDEVLDSLRLVPGGELVDPMEGRGAWDAEQRDEVFDATIKFMRRQSRDTDDSNE